MSALVPLDELENPPEVGLPAKIRAEFREYYAKIFGETHLDCLAVVKIDDAVSTVAAGVIMTVVPTRALERSDADVLGYTLNDASALWVLYRVQCGAPLASYAKKK